MPRVIAKMTSVMWCRRYLNNDLGTTIVDVVQEIW